MEEPKVVSRCRRCNRILRTEDARQKGYGKFCWKLHQLEIRQRGDDLPLFKANQN